MTAVMNKENVNLGSGEVEQRVAVLKRFKVLLSQQRDRFNQYLGVLDKQKDIIKNGNPDQLLAHVDLEEQIVQDIFSIQKVIEPLEVMYEASVGVPVTASSGVGNTVAKTVAAPAEAREVPKLREALKELSAEAVLRADQNRELLAERMKEIRQEMKTLQSNPYAIHHSSYMEEGPALIDIEG
jgi:hypothetical protein